MLIATGEQSLAVVYRTGAAHYGLLGTLATSFSDDGGQSWSPSIEAAPRGLDVRNPAFGRSSTGAWLLAYWQASVNCYPIDPDSGDVEAYLLSDSQQVTDELSISLTGEWITPDPETLTISDIPSATIVDLFTVVEHDGVANMVGVVESTPGTYQASIDATYHLPPAGDDNYQALVIFDDATNGEQALEMQIPYGQGATIDAGNTLLPWIDDYASYDSTTRQIAWTQTGAGTPDVIFASADFNDSNGNEVIWQIAAPPNSSPILLPQLSADFAAQDPMSALVSDEDFDATLFVDIPSVSYDLIRTNPFVQLLPIFSAQQSESAQPREYVSNSIANASWFAGSYLSSSNDN